ncbi:cyclase family protein [Cohnella nanjingensis]|uniref:Cyclase family protein n=1 Tax=Cohnella nanjingensis TaxID=1387779 RepID=A0A7X0VIN8_9BACL|nr:cyclase family protein [Cohnella nanjingensis]MBB6675397.1 cyclase family protein [Cohnella nanjingensis]
MKITDLSLTIAEDVAYAGFPRSLVYGKPESGTRIERVASLEENKVLSHNFTMCTQHFTHYDAPAHFIAGGLRNDEVPLDSFIGPGVMIDLRHKRPGSTIAADDLTASGADVRPGDIAVLRTGWTDEAFGTFRFWDEMIGLSTDAADWLIARGIKSIAGDCMLCDPPLHPPEGRTWSHADWSPNHKAFLSRGIVMLEWLTNLGAVQSPRFLFGCVPIKLKGTDGAPCRAFAIEDIVDDSKRKELAI